MKTRLMLLTLFLVPSASAQLPVIDAAAIAKAVAALVELREQVRLLNQSLSETKAIREGFDGSLCAVRAVAHEARNRRISATP